MEVELRVLMLLVEDENCTYQRPEDLASAMSKNLPDQSDPLGKIHLWAEYVG